METTAYGAVEQGPPNLARFPSMETCHSDPGDNRVAFYYKRASLAKSPRHVDCKPQSLFHRPKPITWSSSLHPDNMITVPSALLLAAIGASGALASPAPAVTPAPALEKRASCTFSGSAGASSASKSQASCATIVLSDVAVPSGTTLDLSDLEDGTHVRMTPYKPPKSDP